MSITKSSELEGMKRVSRAVAVTLHEMRHHARPGMTTRELDLFGARILNGFKAKSAPALTYGFPGSTCISVNEIFAHGIPSDEVILKDGDLINIDVSAELNGFWSDNGCSFVLGSDVNGLGTLVETSREVLTQAIQSAKAGSLISETGRLIATAAKRKGYRVIRNLTGHGIGRRLHEPPSEIPNFYDPHNHHRFGRNSVVAIETFISTRSTLALTGPDGWSLRGNNGGRTVQHEHTLVITDGEPLILTIPA